MKFEADRTVQTAYSLWVLYTKICTNVIFLRRQPPTQSLFRDIWLSELVGLVISRSSNQRVSNYMRRNSRINRKKTNMTIGFKNGTEFVGKLKIYLLIKNTLRMCGWDWVMKSRWRFWFCQIIAEIKLRERGNFWHCLECIKLLLGMKIKLRYAA